MASSDQHDLMTSVEQFHFTLPQDLPLSFLNTYSLGFLGWPWCSSPWSKMITLPFFSTTAKESCLQCICRISCAHFLKRLGWHRCVGKKNNEGKDDEDGAADGGSGGGGSGGRGNNKPLFLLLWCLGVWQSLGIFLGILVFLSSLWPNLSQAGIWDRRSALTYADGKSCRVQ